MEVLLYFLARDFNVDYRDLNNFYSRKISEVMQNGIDKKIIIMREFPKQVIYYV